MRIHQLRIYFDLNRLINSFFSFKKSEIFLLINQRPVSPVEIQLLIENSEERLTEAQVERLLEMVADNLPSHVTESDEGEEEEQEEEEGAEEPPDGE